MTTQVQPYCCAVCWRPLDRYQGQWVHGRAVWGAEDHLCVPVPYDATKVQVRCDFCDQDVPIEHANTLPARDFVVVLPDGTPIWGSNGGWCACETCAGLLSADEWEALIDRALSFKPAHERDTGRMWLILLYPALRANITGPVRRFQPGDEMTTKD